MDVKKYENQKAYPRSARRPVFPGPRATAEEAETYAEQLKTYEAAQREVEELRAAHHAETDRLHTMFKADLLEELDLTRHPKADLLFAKAWDRGHSCGLQGVVDEAYELAELLDP